MPVILLPKRLDLTARRDSAVTSRRRPAIIQGSSWYQAGVIVDENGDPFDLGPTLNPHWTLAAQVRRDIADRSTTPLASFTVTVLDGPNGSVAWALTPAQTLLLSTSMRLVWDFDATNLTDIRFDVGWRATIWAGRAEVIRDVTR